MKKKRVGIFGGAFDPVHNGHVAIARSFLESKLIHTLWILPTPDPPHKPDRKLTLFQHRLRMLTLAFEGVPGIEVRDIENRLPKPSYTLQTVDFLQEKYPDSLFYLCMGEDSLRTFTSWYKYHKILDRISLLVAERDGGERLKIPREVLESAIFTEHQALAVSSTNIRDKVAGNADNAEGGESNDLPDAVSGYIRDQNLYSTDT